MKNFYKLILSCLLLMAATAANAQNVSLAIEPSTSFCGGTGSPGDPYLICTPEQLDSVRYYLDKHFQLVKDIDLSGYPEVDPNNEGWKPIGDNSTDDATSRFTGTFDGAGFKVKNLTISGMVLMSELIEEDDEDDWWDYWWDSENAINNVGLFGCTEEATIQNLGIENCSIVGGYKTGGLVGYNLSSTIHNCYSTGSVLGISGVGGLVGTIKNATITHCYSTCTVSCIEGETGNVGGLVGANENSSIINSFASGSVWGQMYVGGLSGSSFGDTEICRIENCYATGNVFGERAVGGLTGYVSNSIILNCYASGQVTGGEYAHLGIGGLLGWITSSSVKNCVAANPSVIIDNDDPYGNRIVGKEESYYGATVFTNNYANEDMIVKNTNGNLPVTPGSDLSGINKSMATFKTFAFYNTGTHWLDNVPWNMDDDINPAKIWRICDTKTLPFFQWQEGIVCDENLSAYGLLFDVETEKFYLNISGGITVGTNPVYTGQSASWSWNSATKTLTLKSFTWKTTAAVALTIINGNIIIKQTGSNIFKSSYNGTFATMGVYVVEYSLILSGGGQLHGEAGTSVATSNGIYIESGDFTLNKGRVSAQGETQAIFSNGSFILPNAYSYLTNTIPSPQSGQPNYYTQNGSGMPFVNSNIYKYVKITTMVAEECVCK